MTHWSLIKHSTVATNINDQDIKVEQPNISTPTEDSNQKLNVPKSTPAPFNIQQNKPKFNTYEAVSGIDSYIKNIMHEFQNPSGKFYKDFYLPLYRKNPEYANAWHTFFYKNIAGRNAPWFTWLSNHASHLINSGIQKSEDGADLTYVNSRPAIKQWITTNPDEVGKSLQSMAFTNPLDLAKAVEQYIGRGDYSSYQVSADDTGANGEGLALNQMSNQSIKGLDEEDLKQNKKKESTDDAPGTEDVAELFSRKTANKVVAPDISEEERSAFDDLNSEMQFMRKKAVLIRQKIDAENEDEDVKSLSPQEKKIYQGMKGYDEVLSSLKQVKHENGEDIYFKLRSPQTVVSQAVNWPLMGISENTKIKNANGQNVAMTNWQEFAIQTGIMTADELETINSDPERMEDVILTISQEHILGGFSQEFLKFSKEKMDDYLRYAYEVQYADELNKTSDEFRPKSHNFDAFRRMAKLSAAAAKREMKLEEIDSTKRNKVHKSGTPTRRWAYISTRLPAIIDRLQNVTNSKPGTYIPFGVEELKNKGKARFIYKNEDGSLGIVKVDLNEDIILNSQKKIQDYVKANATENTPITSFNWPIIAQLVGQEYYVPKMFDMLEKHDKNSLRKEGYLANDDRKTYDPALGLKLAEEGASLQGGGNDFLQGYRAALAKHINNVIKNSGVTKDEILDIVENRQIYSDSRVSSSPGLGGKNSKEWLNRITDEKGIPEKYDNSDFVLFTWALNVARKQKDKEADEIDVKSVFAPSMYFDRYNKNDKYDLLKTLQTSVATFGRYIVHRARVQQLRGFKDSTWSPKTIANFIQMNVIHANYSKHQKTKNDEYYSDTVGVGAPLQDLISPSGLSLRNDIGNSEDLSGLTPEEKSKDFINKMQNVPRGDIYRGLNPKSPNGLMVNYDKNENGIPVLDENGIPKNIREEYREPDPKEMWDSISKSIAADYPEISPNNQMQILNKLKELKIQELDNAESKYKKDLDQISGALGDIVSSAKFLASVFKVNPPQSGQEQEYVNKLIPILAQRLFAQHSHKVAKDTEKDPNNADLKRQSIYKRWAERLDSLRAKDEANGVVKSDFDYAKEFIENRQKASDVRYKQIAQRKKYVEQFNPTVNSKGLKDIIDTIVPIKYLRNTTFEGAVPGSNAYENVKKWVNTNNPKKNTAEHSLVNIVYKTAGIISKLSNIREKSLVAKIPTDNIDRMLDTVDKEFEKYLVLENRRYYGGRYANKNSSSMWTLL